uniref:SF3 helicase domain-containing protein n=1 Tax=viral metagenome TaxID=1070528 RepID=A0A6C0J7H0_9ZZZZ
MSIELSKFLRQYESTGTKDEEGKAIFTHTSLNPRASYNIPMDNRMELHKLIAIALCNKKQVFLTEKPLQESCIKIDIDLKYAMNYSNRQHNDNHIKELLKLYATAISSYIDMPEDHPIDAYVFQRNNPYPAKGNMKDGIHILYPNICCHVDIQHAIRSEVLKKIDLFLKNPNIGILDIKNSNDDVVDLAVISRNNWLMYGSRKPGNKPYTLYKVLRLKKTKEIENENEKENKSCSFSDFEELAILSKGVDNVETLINLLSVHRVPKEYTFEVREEVSDIVDAISTKKIKKEVRTGYRSNTIKKQTLMRVSADEQKAQIEEATKLVDLLAGWRTDDYDSWIDVGICLHNISPSLIDVWIKFSKRSDSWQPIDEKRWYGFSESISGLNIGSLHRWARLDDPKNYNEARSGFLENLMMCSVSGVTQDVAQVIHKMFQHQYICLDAKGRKWAEFVNHSWKITEDGMSLKKKLGKDVLHEYLFLVNRYNTMAMESVDENKDHYLHRSKSLADVSYKLRDITFKEKVMKECVILFYDPKFEDTLDENPFLVGLENGVYDLKECAFRDGRPEDRVSMSTLNDFPEYEKCDISVEEETSSIREAQEIMDFMKQIMPKDASRRYFWKFLASCLQGYNTDEKFHVLTGTGGNGKSKVIELLEMAYGQYCFKLPITFITSKRSQTGQATPELMMGKKARFGSMQEPDEGSKINTGLMKELSGNDKMFLRGLYSGGEQFKPQFSLALLCNNKPKMTGSDDDGTWRRMVVLEFIAKFVEGKPNGPYEFSRNTDLPHNFPYWSPWFFVLLTHWYKIYKSEGLLAPKEISDATKEYRKDSDSYAMFIDDFFIKDANGNIKLEEAYSYFETWFKSEYSDDVPKRRCFKTYIERALNQSYGSGNKSGWTGWSVQHPTRSNNDKDDDDIPEFDNITNDNKVSVNVKPRQN